MVEVDTWLEARLEAAEVEVESGVYQLQPVPSAYVWDAGVVAQLRQEGA